MPLSRHSFVAANTDDEPGSAGAGSNTFVSAINIFLEPGSVLPATGNVLVPYALPAQGITRSLGGFEDGSTGTAVALYYNSAGRHRLVRYTPGGGAGQITTLLEWQGLNLAADLVPQGGVVDGLLIYLGADGLLRSINLQRAADGFYNSALLEAEPFALHLVKVPPSAAPLVQRVFATGDPRDDLRIIQTKAYQFALRWRYADGEVTVLSPFSDWMDVVEDPATTLRTAIQLGLPVAPSGVTEVEVLVREAANQQWLVADILRRTPTVPPAVTYFFYGIVSGAALTPAEATRLFESEWPGKAAVLARSRAFKGNMTEGYLTADAAFTAAIVAPGGIIPDVRTLHERATYRVTTQFYDAQGKPFGCGKAQTIIVPAQGSTKSARALSVTLTTAAGDQDAEIPAEAWSIGFLVARNDRTTEFRQGQAADTRAFIGNERIVNADGSIKEQPILRDRNTTAHEKLWVDIGGWPSVGLGYVWNPESGDILRFLEDNVEFPVTGQFGDYVEVKWNGKPVLNTPTVEIYTPNTTAADTYYERGPRIPIVRENGTRRYAVQSLVLPGDCFITTLNFPQLQFDGNYMPPYKKVYLPATVPVTVESMTPLYRLTSGSLRTITTQELATAADDASNPTLARYITRRLAAAQIGDILDPQNINVGANFTAIAGGAGSGVWLDMGYGGRPGLAVPLALQRVVRPNLLRFPGVKQQGNLLNGLSEWDAASQYDELPQEYGGITRLAVADQTQSDGSVLFVTQERGANSIGLGRGQIQTGEDVLITVSRQVIGSSNTLRGGFGCTDPAGLTPYAGKVFYPCREREEVLRYDRNGVVALGETYKFSNRLKALFRQYTGAAITGCYNPRRKEYLLTFQPTGDLPGATVVFSDRPNREAWADQISAIPEAGLGVGNELVMWQAGALWRHTPTAPSETFFGEKTRAQIQFICAAPTDVAKRWQSAEVVAPTLWRITFVYTDTGQQSQTLAEWWQYREGVFRLYEGFRRDQNTPGYPGKPFLAMDNGDPLISPRLTVTLEGPTSPSALSSVGISWLPRSGQQMGQ